MIDKNKTICKTGLVNKIFFYDYPCKKWLTP